MTRVATGRTVDIIDYAPEDNPNHLIATYKAASEDAVKAILAADPDDENGRSEFLWIRLTNGDLILGVFPQADTYFAWEREHSS